MLSLRRLVLAESRILKEHIQSLLASGKEHMLHFDSDSASPANSAAHSTSSSSSAQYVSGEL